MGVVMRVSGLRRWNPGIWRRLMWLAPIVLIVEALIMVSGIAEARAETRVAFVQAEARDSFSSERVYAGRTVAGRVSELGFKQAGQLVEMRVDLGDRVDAGQLLARLDAAALEAALAQADADVDHAAATLEATRARADLARETERRYADLKGSGHVSAQQYDEQRLELTARMAEVEVARAGVARARAARTAAQIALAESRIEAPFAGTIQARYHDEGRQLQPGEAVLRLVETGRLEAHVGVPEAVAPGLNVASSYRLRWNGQTLTATLAAVLPEVDPATRTLTAVFRLTDAEVPLGAVVELEAARQVHAAGFWLPLTALTESDRGLWGVFVIAPDSTLERRIVEVLHTESDRVFVRGTLSEGERVVRTGVQRLVPGQRVEPVVSG